MTSPNLRSYAQALYSAVLRYRRSLKGTTVATIER
jgi:hypothetical protein